MAAPTLLQKEIYVLQLSLEFREKRIAHRQTYQIIKITYTLTIGISSLSNRLYLLRLSRYHHP